MITPNDCGIVGTDDSASIQAAVDRAAALAIKEDVAVQDVPYSELSKRLVADGQVIKWANER